MGKIWEEFEDRAAMQKTCWNLNSIRHARRDKYWTSGHRYTKKVWGHLFGLTVRTFWKSFCFLKHRLESLFDVHARRDRCWMPGQRCKTCVMPCNKMVMRTYVDNARNPIIDSDGDCCLDVIFSSNFACPWGLMFGFLDVRDMFALRIC